jgi:hypothetical protein
VVTTRADRLPAAIMHTDALTAVLQNYCGALHVEARCQHQLPMTIAS